MHRKTKVVCTIGPASSSYDRLCSLAESGMNVARLNFSHGSHREHSKVIENIKRLRQEKGFNIGILQDLSGPKIRVGELNETGIELKTGSYIRLVSDPATQTSEPAVPIQYSNLIRDVPAGATILLDDGLLALETQRIEKNSILCRVVHGGLLQSHKGVNFPGLTLSQTVPTPKDIEDLRYGLANCVDFVAQSFVQTADDIQRLKSLIQQQSSSAAVIAKLERGAALENLDAILQISDGVMVARGDLGIEADLSMIAIYQKQIVRQANFYGLFVITATQMLDSMIRQPMPTRAEVTDVSNAVYDGSDAVMLSGETSVGNYPIETVQIMRKIADNVENNLGLDRNWVRQESEDTSYSSEMAVASSACEAAERLQAKLIVAFSISGKTAKSIAMYRPSTPVIAMTPLQSTYHQLSIVWGIEAVLLPHFERDFLEAVRIGENLLKKMKYIEDGDLIVISAGIPAGEVGGTNVMKIHTVGA